MWKKQDKQFRSLVSMILQNRRFHIVLIGIVLGWFLLGKLNWGQIFNFVQQIPVVGLIVTYNFRPADYSVPRLDVPLSQHMDRLEFSCKYRGYYEFDIVGYYGRPLDRSPLVVYVKIEDSEGRCLFAYEQKRSVVASVSFKQTGERYLRFCHAAFNAPDDVPLGKPLFLSFSVAGPVDDFLSAHHQARVRIQKFLDK